MTSFLKPGAPHHIDEIRSPIAIILRCSCGWTRSISRQQNALARAAKVRAAIAEHEKAYKTRVSTEGFSSNA
jgi:hypothetical protein